MTKIKAVLFNGPPRSGKDTAAACLHQCLIHQVSTFHYLPFVFKMAESLKLAAHALFGEEQLAADAFEDCKDEPHPIFLGKTPRQIYIALSEGFAKQRYGQDFFSQIFMRRAMNKIKKETEHSGHDAMIICSDLGFESEARALVDAIGAENVLIVHIHRAGCDFENDSRSYIRLEGVKMLHIRNDNLMAFKMEVIAMCRSWVGRGVQFHLLEPAYA